jgi:hypothetical protein
MKGVCRTKLATFYFERKKAEKQNSKKVYIEKSLMSENSP